MTYDARERSVELGEPIEIYTFGHGSIISRFTSDAVQQVVSGDTYAPAALRRSQIEQSAERARNAITITCARDFPIADLFRVAPPSEVIAVTVRRKHRTDADVAVIWMGRVVNCEWRDSEATLNCEPVSSSLRRMGLRRKYQRQCPHVLYMTGPGQCNVNRATYSTDTTVVSQVGTTLTVAALAGGVSYPGGFVEWVTPAGAIERRFISESLGAGVLKLSQAFQGITAGQAVTVSPGCDHTTAMCAGTFSNLDNYGGFPFIPLKNPFGGSPVY